MLEWCEAPAYAAHVALLPRVQDTWDGLTFPGSLIHDVMQLVTGGDVRSENAALIGLAVAFEVPPAGSLVRYDILRDGRSLPQSLNIWPRTHDTSAFYQAGALCSRFPACVLDTNNDKRASCPAV